uniref:Uncharacterized protein n=1 Tax=Cacopsylla melanoneura TaxID=428564 RepID=A0A8D8RH72_9HEMI
MVGNVMCFCGAVKPLDNVCWYHSITKNIHWIGYCCLMQSFPPLMPTLALTSDYNGATLCLQIESMLLHPTAVTKCTPPPGVKPGKHCSLCKWGGWLKYFTHYSGLYR